MGGKVQIAVGNACQFEGVIDTQIDYTVKEDQTVTLQ